MRDIKFRVWNDIDKKMVDWSTLKLLPTLIVSSAYNKQKHYKLMQYTGLKDKSGIEIYEGDIVKAFTVFGMTYDYSFEDDNDPNNIYEILFDDGCFQFKNTKQWSDGSNDWRSIENVELFKVEVIGNIYENPELLKGE